MYVGDSRALAGPGFLPLQHHDYRGKGWSLDGRSAVLAMRIVDRRDAPGQLGRWVYKDESVGDLTGGFLWDKDTRPVSGWRFSWPAIVGADSRSITPPPIISPPPISTAPTTPPATGSTPGTPPSGGTSPRYSSAYIPKGSTLTIGGQMIVLTAAVGPGLGAGNLIKIGAGGAVGAAAAAGAAGVAKGVFKPNAVNQWAGGGPGGVNAFGQKNLGLLFPGAGAVGNAPNVFGINVQWLNPVYPWAPNPRAPFGLQVNPMGINVAGALAGDRGNFSMAGQFASAKKKEESDSKAWYSGDLDVGVTRPPDELFPVWKQWDPDRRFKGLVPSKPVHWPDIPRGFYGVVLDSTEENDQNPLFLPTDPRLVAAHRNFPPMGSLVADIDPNGSVDIHRMARLQTALRVARKPSGTVGILKRNTGNRATNWLALVIGPSGGWDGAGGLVVDTPWGGAPDRDFRIFAALSQREGGPFDVGTRGDLHGIGKTADGEVINSLHISTGALFLRKGSVTEDGPLAFESVWQDGIDFDITTKVHFAFNQRAGSWGWWTTSPLTTVTTDTPDPGPPPVTPTPRPPTPVTPRPNGPVGGPPEGGGAPDPGAGGAPGPDRGGNAVNPPSGGLGGTGSTINASYREIGLPSISGRPTFMRKGETDLRFARYATLADRVAVDARTPLVGRIEAFGAQGGTPGGPHVTGGRESSGWAYTTRPGASRWKAGTTSGGWALLPPEVELSSIDKGLRPTQVPTSESYLVATIGTHFAAGTPELSTGRVKDGYSWTYDPAIDLLVFSDRDTVGDALPVFAIGPYGYNQKVKTTAVDYTVERGITVVIATAGLTVTLPAAADPGVLGTLIIVKSNTTGNLTITDPTSTIDGSASTTINQRYNSVQLFCDGTEWFIV